MIKNLKKKVTNYLKKEEKTFQENLSSVAVNFALQKDLLKKLNQNRKQILENYDFFVDNYIQIITYLYNDFGIKKAKLDNELTDLLTELNLPKIIKNILKQKLPFKIKIMDRFSYNKNLKKWWILSTILRNYKDALNLLKECSKQDTYKDIDFDTHFQEYENNKNLIEDFSYLEK